MKAVIRVENFKSRKTKKAKEYIEKWILAKDLINLVKSNIPEFKNWKNATIGEPTRVHMP